MYYDGRDERRHVVTSFVCSLCSTETSGGKKSPKGKGKKGKSPEPEPEPEPEVPTGPPPPAPGSDEWVYVTEPIEEVCNVIR